MKYERKSWDCEDKFVFVYFNFPFRSGFDANEEPIGLRFCIMLTLLYQKHWLRYEVVIVTSFYT